MSDENVVRINKHQGSDLEFTVKIEGAEDLSEKTVVRFVIKVDESQRLTFLAEHVSEDKWTVKIPSLDLDAETYDMAIEVLVDNYFFEPAQGQVVIMTDPIVKVASDPKAKEKLKVIKEAAEKTAKKTAEETAEEILEERAPGAGTAHSYTAPTAALLKTERKPKDKHKPKAKQDPKEELDKIKKIASKVTPNDGAVDYAQESQENKIDYNPRSVAERIIMNTLGSVKKQRVEKAGSGYLFKKDESGKPVVLGLLPPEVRAALAEEANAKAEKIKELLRELSN